MNGSHHAHGPSKFKKNSIHMNVPITACSAQHTAVIIPDAVTAKGHFAQRVIIPRNIFGGAGQGGEWVRTDPPKVFISSSNMF